MKIGTANDYVQMRTGGSYVGEVTQKSFLVTVGFSPKPVKIATKSILHIVFNNKYGYPVDEINLKDGSQVQGTVEDDEVAFRSEELGDMTIKTKTIFAIQFLGNL